MNINNLSLNEKIGQRFIIGINNERIDEVIGLIKNANEGYKIINRYKKVLSKHSEFAKKLNEDVKRIIAVKEKYKISDDTNNVRINIGKINEEIDKINLVVYN